MTPQEAAELAQRIVERLGHAVVGKDAQLRLTLAGVLANGHILIEDNPGLAKTLLARSLAQALGLDFKRVQFTPDLLPADITGSYVYNPRDAEFAFRAGPLFAHLVLADELNRTPPKTQAALLEAMQERQVTVEGTTFDLPEPFFVVATANPIEYEGTYSLPEAQLDRFLLRISMGYPALDDEREMLARRFARRREAVELEPVTDREGVLAMQAAVETVEIDPSVVDYCLQLVLQTRSHPDLLVGASPRGSLALTVAARAHAVVSGRDYVIPEDVQAIAVAALAHRVTLKPELWLRGGSTTDVVRGVLAGVAVPAQTGSP